MRKAESEDAKSIDGDSSDPGARTPPEGMSPYATGGGGVTFERKVAVQYLAHLLVGDGAVELGDGRRVVSVAFQQAPSYTVDESSSSRCIRRRVGAFLGARGGGSAFTESCAERRAGTATVPAVRRCCDQRASRRAGSPLVPCGIWTADSRLSNLQS